MKKMNTEMRIPGLITPGGESLAAVKQVLVDPAATDREKILAREVQCLQHCVISIVDGLAQASIEINLQEE